MATGPSPSSLSAGGVGRAWKAAKVIVVGSVMFTFISYWKTAAVVLCDLASTAYYIGGIVETAIGPAAPWFILAVMLFSYAVRSVYIESCSLFVRGGVYKVVKEAMGGPLAKLSVSALMFDYILTGPISGVSAGQYLTGLFLDIAKVADITLYEQWRLGEEQVQKNWKQVGSVIFATAITLYFFRKNLLGIHESSDKAFKIMVATTIMAAIMLVWCTITLIVRVPEGTVNAVPLEPNFQPKMNYDKGEKDDPLGFLRNTGIARQFRNFKSVGKPEGKDKLALVEANGQERQFTVAPGARITLDGRETAPDEIPEGTPVRKVAVDRSTNTVQKLEAASHSGIDWLTWIGAVGILIAFGHSILAMSGEETLAQVYREVESPKLPNFKKAAFIVFVYSLLLTAGISFFAVLLVPNSQRMPQYSGNLISGLAMNVIGPEIARLLLNAFVVVVGFLILAGAVNTAIIGSNGVLNRVAEDGVMPDWFLKPHPRFGTTYRMLYLIVALQLIVIFASRGDVIMLGEAYAFGVVWSFVFKALAMVVLRFRDHSPREFKVPLNIRLGKVELPLGLTLIFLTLLATAILNLLTKETATIYGGLFTAGFFITFVVSEHYHKQRLKGAKHEHLEQFNRETTDEISPAALRLTNPYRKLVAIRSPQNLVMLEKALAETDPETTDVVVMTAKVIRGETLPGPGPELDDYDQHLMTAVVGRAETAGKQVRPLIVPTNNPLHAVIRTARELQVQELVMGASNKYTADEQLEQIGFYWFSLHPGESQPLTVRILGRDRDVYLDLNGGSRIPKISERKARSVAELRAAGVGVSRVLLAHDGSQESRDLFQEVLTMLDPQVSLTLVPVGTANGSALTGLQVEQEQAKQLRRELDVQPLQGEPGPEIVRLAREGHYDLVILSTPPEWPPGQPIPEDTWGGYLLRHAPCRVLLASPATLPEDVAD
jgi:amino acid transporter/nucleotide-binding universal stress UspA family protein